MMSMIRVSEFVAVCNTFVKRPGGLFAIDRAFFEKLGTYDSGFDFILTITITIVTITITTITITTITITMFIILNR